jgi:pre-mRNA cleavage complex 2 protein Pcf11
MDSIVKNVGTPYTLFFGKRLYETFMGAYASVDQQTRKKMDEMLKTWKEPIPGSLDTRPVFTPDVTRPIENALMKARTSAMQAQHQHMRAEQQLLGRSRPASQMTAPYRHTPTPPNVRPPSHSQPAGGYYPTDYSNGVGSHGHAGPPPGAQIPQAQVSLPFRQLGDSEF